MHLFLNILAFASIGLLVNGEEWCMTQFFCGYQHSVITYPFFTGKVADADECKNRCLNNPACMSSEFRYNSMQCLNFNTASANPYYLMSNAYYDNPPKNEWNPVKSDVALKFPKKNGVCAPNEVINAYNRGDVTTIPNGKKYKLRRQTVDIWELQSI
ncbi:Apple domain-containing protein [Caenorhabditis elegans]|uniref:Apple domain-containing protein n=1 Tax=Caenorhabditis elegans TaxID=6239 RepID=B6EU70_CAEEL|nr:Apple domain-containing protein [Caenorhabditis elegans]CAR81378.1 Apple domain-containing protein [Caenorhabditis elegans]|eukprot:NP_001256750.1 Uncharacterized protein CELE_Y6G8.14 [Caenorhabditis elegans]